MNIPPIDSEKMENEIRSMFYQHTESQSCSHGFHGYMESDGAPYIRLVKPLKHEAELNFE